MSMCGVRANVSLHTDDPSGFRETNVSNPSFDRFPQNRFYIGMTVSRVQRPGRATVVKKLKNAYCVTPLLPRLCVKDIYVLFMCVCVYNYNFRYFLLLFPFLLHLCPLL